MTSNELTTTAPQAATVPAKREKKARIPKRIAEAVRLLASGECKSIKAASERVQMNYTHLCEALKKPHVEAFTAKQAAENISRGVLRASARYVELIEAQSEHVAARVSERFLEHGGIIKPQAGGNSVNVSINNSVAVGYVVDLAPQAPVIDASHALPNDDTGNR
jgi:hypothetical protein